LLLLLVSNNVHHWPTSSINQYIRKIQQFTAKIKLELLPGWEKQHNLITF